MPLKYGAGPEKGRVVSMMRVVVFLVLGMIPFVAPVSATDDESCVFDITDLPAVSKVDLCMGGEGLCVSMPARDICAKAYCYDFDADNNIGIDLPKIDSSFTTIAWTIAGYGVEENGELGMGYHTVAVGPLARRYCDDEANND